MKKTFLLILFISLLGVAFTTEESYRRRNTEGPADTPATTPSAGTPPAGGAEPPKPIKIDKVAIFTPELDVSMANRPQIIIKRHGEAKPSENQHFKLLADDPCTLRQGYVLFQRSIDETSTNPILYTTPSFCVLNKHTISFFDSENVHT